MRTISMALLGLGTVGGGVAEALRKNASRIRNELGCDIEIRYALVRDRPKYVHRKEAEGLRLTSSFDDILNDPEISVVAEMMGGVHPAKEYILKALQKKINVVSANKDLIAEYGKDIMETAAENKADFGCEASVGGGIPILMPLHQSLAANEIEGIMGIVNGTTNYILSSMAASGNSYETALHDAQAAGFAEADPTSDVCGYDAARKLAILASIGFRANVTFSDVLTEGIENISQEDIRYGKEMGYAIKLLAVAQKENDGIVLHVYPAFLPAEHPLSSVSGSYNAIYVTGNVVGDVMFYGKGAGSLPTASAVLGDIIHTAKNILHHTTGQDLLFRDIQRPEFCSPLKLKNVYYFRIIVDDLTGVLSQIATVFAGHHISIREVVQKRRMEDSAELVIITEEAQRDNVLRVKAELTDLSCVQELANMMRVL